MARELASQPAALRPFLISFSGIDGAGKTTQIERLAADLTEAGLSVLRLNFWEHVAVWPNLRAGIGYRSIDRQAGHPLDLSFAPKNNKHIRKWYLTAARSGFYLLDVGRLQAILNQRFVRQHDVVLFDRYIYDQIANLYSRTIAARSYSRLLVKVAPIPDLAFIVDAAPAEAFARKPEYPLDFVYRNRRSFLQLREIHPSLIVIPPAGPDEVAQVIRDHVERSWLLEARSHTGKADPRAMTAVLREQTFPIAPEEPTAKI